MKKSILVTIAAIFALAGCKTTYETHSGGKENESFIQLVADSKEYESGITLIVDNAAPVQLEKVVPVKKQLNAKPYVTTPGKHTIKVLKGDKVLFEQTVFLGLQETKKIVLR